MYLFIFGNTKNLRINRIIMEFKCIYNIDIHKISIRINRIIMEFKLCNNLLNTDRAKRINRIIMEFKSGRRSKGYRGSGVELIES